VVVIFFGGENQNPRNCSLYFRELAEAFGRKPAASRFSTELSKSHILGAPTGHVYSRADLIRQFMYGTTECFGSMEIDYICIDCGCHFFRRRKPESTENQPIFHNMLSKLITYLRVPHAEQ
jgi:hypothetical protein